MLGDAGRPVRGWILVQPSWHHAGTTTETPNRVSAASPARFELPGELNQGLPNEPYMGQHENAERYDVYATRPFASREAVIDAIDKFARSYSGPWRVTGPNCHTFQEDMDQAVGLRVATSGER